MTAERAVKHGDLLEAWTWQHLALLHGVDLTVSTMRAYHDAGPQDGVTAVVIAGGSTGQVAGSRDSRTRSLAAHAPDGGLGM